MISCLSEKYELLHFAELTEEATITKNKILALIEANNFNGLKARCNHLTTGGTKHEKFIKDYTAHINQIQDVATKCGLNIYSNLSEDYLDRVGRKAEWLIDRFFEFQFLD